MQLSRTVNRPFVVATDIHLEFLEQQPKAQSACENLIAGIHGWGQLVSVWHRVEFAQELHMPAVEVSVQAGLVLRSVRAEGTVELWFHAALVLQMPGQAGVVIVHFATVLARVGDSLAVQVARRTLL